MSEHYFSSAPNAQSRPRPLEVRLAGHDLTVTTDAGVFSPGRVDKGTAVLLDRLPEVPAGNLLDMGCGWGPIALHAGLAARDAGTDTRIWALDVNERSLELTKKNAAEAGLSSIRPVTAEQIPDDVRFDAIWSNPPIRVGKDVLHELLLTWLPRLTPGGEALLVVAKNLGSDSLQKWMQENLPEGFTISRAASSKGFRILSAVAPE
ncbi:MFS transporter [Brevibacterium sp. HMSC08F02]|uniref:class I SAM-dependent methyltransferase n=1 Tax=unclassified Brevibacterium TaxID=2614124 RepID=UPI0008A3B874|nr:MULTISPECIES: methyltransferase [unclassified Brevibacterium]OFT27195.1 MFS transporter [Brevibacterium sp. HMSC08F02]OFT92087.1 MFS transporter [Brevibacterium sp. HMSC24B04]